MKPAPHIRPARDDDGPSLIAIIQQAFAQYEGCIFAIEEMPDLNSFATSTASRGGSAWVAELDAQVVGCVAVEPSANGFELHRLYVQPGHWGSPIGHALMATVEAAVQARGGTTIELWSDVKFERAHRFYERRGYVRNGETRELHDLSNTVEYYFQRQLG